MALSHKQLAAKIADAAVLHGQFTLRSGRTSSYYVDKYRFSTRPEILRELGERLAARVPAGTTRLAGAELGGIPLVSAASMAAGLPCVFIRNQKKNYGTAKLVEGELNEGDSIVIVEDVATTGGQVIEAAKALTDMGARVTMIIAVIDREEGARANIEQAGYGFEALFTTADLGISAETGERTPNAS